MCSIYLPTVQRFFPLFTCKYPTGRTQIFIRLFASERLSQPQSLFLVQSGKLVESTTAEILKTASQFSKVHIDLGTGDAKYVYRQARGNPEIFYMGIEPNPGLLHRISCTIAKKPSRGGGQKNVALISSSVESLPSHFSSVSDHMTINFPWSSLLKGLVVPHELFLEKIVNLGKHKSTVDMSFNYTVFEDVAYCKQLGIGTIDLSYFQNKLKPIYQQLGIIIKSIKVENSSQYSTTWGKHLTLGSGRKVLLLQGKIERKPTSQKQIQKSCFT